MSKKRNSRKLRPQEYPDMEDFDYDRDKCSEDPAPPTPLKPPKTADWSVSAAYREGALVTISETGQAGTVVQCVGNDLMVLDCKGFVHRVEAKDVYKTQLPHTAE